MASSIGMSSLGMAVQFKYFHDAVPNDFSPKSFRDRHAFNVRGMDAVKPMYDPL